MGSLLSHPTPTTAANHNNNNNDNHLPPTAPSPKATTTSITSTTTSHTTITSVDLNTSNHKRPSITVNTTTESLISPNRSSIRKSSCTIQFSIDDLGNCDSIQIIQQDEPEVQQEHHHHHNQPQQSIQETFHHHHNHTNMNDSDGTDCSSHCQRNRNGNAKRLSASLIDSSCSDLGALEDLKLYLSQYKFPPSPPKTTTMFGVGSDGNDDEYSDEYSDDLQSSHSSCSSVYNTSPRTITLHFNNSNQMNNHNNNVHHRRSSSCGHHYGRNSFLACDQYRASNAQEYDIETFCGVQN